MGGRVTKGCARWARTGVMLAAVMGGEGLAARAEAQVSTGGIRGIVRDTTGGILAGVTIEASSPARIGGAAVAVTGDQGAYRLENLPVGVYVVTFNLSGFTVVRREGIRVEVGRSIQLDQELALSTVQETVTVSGETPVVDAVHAGASANLNQDLLANIPTSRTQFFDVVPLAAGAKPTSGNIGAGSGFNIFGSDSQQNAFQYDGVDVSAPSFGGPFDWPNYDMMEELQVKAVGASAEFAGFQGGVINLVLKSGTNQYRGTGSFYGIWNSLQANNTPNERFPRHTHHRLDYNYTFGGPLVKDRVWMQYIAEHIRWKRSEIGVPSSLPQLTRIWRPFVKVTARLSANDQFSIHYNDCRDWWGYGASATTPLDASSVEIGYDPVVTAGWTHTFGNATLLEVKTGGVFVRKDYVPYSGDLVTPGVLDLSTGNVSVNRPFPNNRDNQAKMNVNATLAHTATDFTRGTHEFKFGVQTAPWNEASSRGAYASGTKIYTLGTTPYYALTQEPYALGGRIRTFGTFAQDDWTVSDRVTVNLGIRYDRTIADVPALEQLDSQFNATGKTFPAVTDLISFSDVSPRLGINVKLDREGRTVVKSHYGRYFNKLVAPGFWSSSPGNTLLSAFFYNTATGRYDIPYYTVDPKANYGIDADLTNQWTDQFFVGIERQLASNFGVNAYGVIKREQNLLRLADVGATYAPRAFTDTFQGRTQTLTVFDRVTSSATSLFQVTNRDDLDQDYKTFVIEGNRRMASGWQASLSYQWQRSLIYNRGGIGAQNFNTLNRNGFGRDPNDLINAYGRSAIDSTHGIRLTGTWEAPWGVQVGARYYYDSGRPYGRVVNVRLSQGVRQVLAQPRGDFALPALNDLRLRLDKAFRFASDRRLRLSLDLINLFNGDTPTSIRNNSSQANFYDGTVGIINVVEPRRAQLGVRVEF